MRAVIAALQPYLCIARQCRGRALTEIDQRLAAGAKVLRQRARLLRAVPLPAPELDEQYYRRHCQQRHGPGRGPSESAEFECQRQSGCSIGEARIVQAGRYRVQACPGRPLYLRCRTKFSAVGYLRRRAAGALMELLRIVIFALLAAIIASLGMALYHLSSGRGDSKKMLRALTWRISLSIALFLLLMIAWRAGLIT